VYNEERTVAAVAERLIGCCPQAQCIFIDDGSTDRTPDVLRFKARPQDRVITTAHAGKGSAVGRGIEHALGAFTIIQDADLEYDPGQIPGLLEAAMRNRGAAVFGSRFLTRNPCIYPSRLLGNKVITLCINILFNAHLSDSYTCYKLLPTDLMRSLKLESTGFELESEICCKCLRRGIPIIEIPITYVPRRIEDGKKIRWYDAIQGLLTAARIRLMTH